MLVFAPFQTISELMSQQKIQDMISFNSIPGLWLDIPEPRAKIEESIPLITRYKISLLC